MIDAVAALMISSNSFESALKKQRQKPIIKALKNLCIIAVLGKKRHENIFELVRLINNVSIYVVVLNNLICIGFIARFVIRLRTKFSMLFIKMLEKQLVLKNILTIEDFNKIYQDIRFDFAKDNYFNELKDSEVISNRINLARNMQDMVGKYYSQEWLRKVILQQSEDDIEEMDSEIEEESNSGDERWQSPEQQDQDMQGQELGDDSAQVPGADDSTNTDVISSPGSAKTEKTDAEKIKEAQSIVDRIGAMNPKLRTMQDLAKYHSALQIIAKNK